MLTYSCQSCLDSGQVRVAEFHRYEPCPDCAPPVKGEVTPRVFIVIGSTGCYEEHQEWISSVHATEAGAQKWVAGIESRLKAVSESLSNINSDSEARVQWRSIYRNVDPECPSTPVRADLRWWIEEKEVKP